MLKKLPHAVPFLLTLALLLPVAGYRHLWQDEVETAERARSILASGVPRVVDPEGRLSLNAGGLELEEGTLHRLSPWGQYYAGASGLAAGRVLGASEDASVRAPFIAAHALTSSLLSLGLASFGLPVAASVGVGTLLGAQTSRVLYNRSARSPAFLDLLTLLGMLGLGALARGDRRGRWPLAAAIFLLPQFHVFGGGLIASLLALCAVYFYGEWRLAAASAGASLAALLALTRPWAQAGWSRGNEHGFRSLSSVFEVSYAFFFLAAAVAFLWRKGSKRLAGALLSLCAWSVLFVRLGDLHPYSESRYYLSLPLFLIFWPLALPWPKGLAKPRKALIYAAFAAALLPEFLGVFEPWHGLRVVAADWSLQARGERQPLRQALDAIRAANKGTAVLVDYAPQYVNWYLRGAPVALMPDRSQRSERGARNPLWAAPLVEPGWHLSYPTKFNGPWLCSPDCDYRAEGLTPTSKRYKLVSKALGKSFDMCVSGRWITDAWNNAPFAEYELASLRPEGLRRDELVLAVRCAR